MCGIVGKYYRNSKENNQNNIFNMMKTIHHRGPDSSGYFKDNNVVLGFQRLSIIDTVTGNQPLYNETNDVVIIANGEIYNYKELTLDLEGKGHKFSTRSDCEVIAHLYEEYGIDFLSKLNGMFAFALYDKKKNVMFLARDRVGIKPLYFYLDNNVIVFASEIKGVLAADEVAVTEGEDVVCEYLCFRYLVNSKTFFKSIRSLEPGEYVEVSQDYCRFDKYKSISSYDINLWTDTDIVDEIDSTLTKAVQRQMMTDVPLGTQLSGGVDSSLVSHIAAKHGTELNAFTVSFNEASYDESEYAKLIASTSGLNYHQLVVNNREFTENLPKVIWYHDEPLCHANSVNMYLLCKYASNYVKVLLTGEGADELFAGYPRYMMCSIGENYNKINPRIAEIFKSIIKSVPDRRAKKLYDNLGFSDRELIIYNSMFLTQCKVSWLLDDYTIKFKDREALLNSVWRDDVSLLDNLLTYEQMSYLQPILIRQDKMSMAASVESRVPILDNEMVSLANSIPYGTKVKRMTPKYLFKKVASLHIPRKVVYKKKVGFGVPIDEWLRDNKGLGRYLDMLLDCKSSLEMINNSKLETIINQHKRSVANHGDILWPIINYVLWKQQFNLK